MSYATVQGIREAAGLQNRTENETPAGAVNGSNRAFTVKRRPIVDTDYDGDVTVADVQAYVDGSSVTVSEVDAATGVVTLETAPTVDHKVTISYSFSAVTDAYIEGKQEEADSWVDLKVRQTKLNDPPELPLDPVPGVIRTAAQQYASGLILTRDWGARADTEQTSKDGFAKIKLATQLLNDYMATLSADEANKAVDDGSGRQMSAVTDGEVFQRLDPNDEGCYPDDWFMRRQC